MSLRWALAAETIPLMAAVVLAAETIPLMVAVLPAFGFFIHFNRSHFASIPFLIVAVNSPFDQMVAVLLSFWCHL